MKPNLPKIYIDIWSDLVCPWCWIAKKRFDAAVERFEYKQQLEIRHHGFRIADNLPAIPFKEALYKKFGNKQAADNMMSQVKSAGLSEGLVYNFETMLFGDTEDALLLLRTAWEEGVGEELAEHLFRSSITDGRSIFERNELVRMAGEVGMSATAAEAAFNVDTASSSVVRDEAALRAMGVNGVPLYLFNNKYVINGAQEADFFLSALNQVWTESQPDLPLVEGPVCGSDGCNI